MSSILSKLSLIINRLIKCIETSLDFLNVMVKSHQWQQGLGTDLSHKVSTIISILLYQLNKFLHWFFSWLSHLQGLFSLFNLLSCKPWFLFFVDLTIVSKLEWGYKSWNQQQYTENDQVLFLLFCLRHFGM